VILTAIIWFKKQATASYNLLISIMTIQFSYIKTQWQKPKEWIVFNV
jgi:hypothetical protein